MTIAALLWKEERMWMMTALTSNLDLAALSASMMLSMPA
jgi:hypothetical protein